jgi:Uma2 family endonuclease
MATRYRFSVEEFERVFQDVKNLELLEGEIYQMSPIGPRHNYKVMQLNHRLTQRFSGKAIVQVQGSLRLSDQSELQPDFALLRLPEEQYQERLPNLEDVLLIIEVSDTTLEYDRKEKLPVYAQAGIPEYWVVNLIDDVLEVYREPIGRLYRTCTLYKPGETVEFMGEKLEW